MLVGIALGGGCGLAAPAHGFGAPLNDECAGAIDISAGSIQFSTVLATSGMPELPVSCDEGFGLSFVKDVWYRFTPAGDGTLTVTTCSGANIDTRLAAYTGDCENLVLVACNDDTPVCSVDRSLMQVSVLENQPVLIRVGGFDSGGIGTLTLTSDIPPPNDECANASPITINTHAVTTVNATANGPDLPISCSEGSGLNFVQDVWFTHVATCTGMLTVTCCNTANFDTRLAAYTGECSDLTLIGCNDDAPGCAANTSTMIVPVVCDEVVLLRVGAFNGSGNFLLNITCSGDPCIPPPPPCPADIDDSGAVDVSDLLAVITTWGPCVAPPDPCPTDISPPAVGKTPAGDGEVNVSDLLLVITSWGACP
jgi:hypothetical protein